MSTVQKYMPFLASSLLMYVLLFIIYPHYQYYIDPDGTAYLTIAQRYATGDYLKAINGYWSPLACWLTAMLIRIGLRPIPASVVINAIGATGFMYISQSFFLKLGVARRLHWLFNASLIIFLCFAIFWQSFDDLWECFFLLSALRVMLNNRFAEKPVLWIATGAIGALAYFAKAYSFPLFILNILCCGYYIASKNKWLWLKISATAIGTMLLLSLPWIYALHYKYGIWTTSTSGTLNMSWYLVGHPYWKEGITHLLPPAYPDSPYYWEDPYIANGITPHFWSSAHLFGLQFLRIGINLYKLVVSMLQLSVFFPVVALIALGATRYRKAKTAYPQEIKLVTFSFLLFPLGYVLINFESRYLWYMLPLSMVLADFIIKRHLPYLTRRLSVNAIYVLLAISYATYPISNLYAMYHAGTQQAQLATLLQAKGIKGSFTSNAQPGRQMQDAVRLAYFSGNPYYAIPTPNDVPHAQLLAEMRKYHIHYYFMWYKHKGDANVNFVDEAGHPFTKLLTNEANGVNVFQIDTTHQPNNLYKQ